MNYVDDVTIAGPVNEVHALLKSIQDIGDDIGYILNQQKCIVCIPNGKDKPDIFKDIGGPASTWMKTMGVNVSGNINEQKRINKLFLKKKKKQFYSNNKLI